MNELKKMDYVQDEEIDLFELIDIMVKRKLFIIISFILFTIVGFGGAIYYRSVKPFVLAKQFSINYTYAEKDYFFNKSEVILNQLRPNNILLVDEYINKFFKIDGLEELYKKTSPKDNYSKVKFLQDIIKINFDEKTKNYTLEIEIKKNIKLQENIINTYIEILKNELKTNIVSYVDEKYLSIYKENEKAKNDLKTIEEKITEILTLHSKMISEKTSIAELINIVNPSIIIEKNKISDIYTRTSNQLLGMEALKKDNNVEKIIKGIIQEDSSIYAIDIKSKAKFILLGFSIFGIVIGTMGAFVLEFIENYKKSRA